jgi:hypothetical protein
MFLQHEDLRVKTQSFADVRRRRHWRRTLLGGVASETHLELWQWWWSAGGVALCVAAVVVRLVRVGREVRRAHGGVASVGALGAVVISVMVERRCYFLNSLKYPSPWQRSEAMDEARPPHRVARIGGFIGAATGVFCRSNVRAESSTTWCV